MSTTKNKDPFFDLDNYINRLEKTIEQQNYTIDSLKKEIKIQRKEIAALREERRQLLNSDQPPMFDQSLWIEPNQ